MSTRQDAPGSAFWGDVEDDVALRRYCSLVDAIDDGLFELDGEGQFVAVNEALARTTGHAREDLLGEHVSVVLADEDVEQVEHAIGVAVEGDDTLSPFEVDVRTADGRTVSLEVRFSPLSERDEEPRCVGVARDRNESTEREAPPEQSAGRDGPQQPSTDDSPRQQTTDDTSLPPSESISSVLDEANIGVFVLDDQFDIAWIDETVEEYFGLDRSEVVGRDKRQTIEETIKHRVYDSEAFEERVLATYDDNSYIEQFECRVRASEDGEWRWLEHYSKPIESGAYAGGRIEFYYDVTERKASEDALQETEEQFQSLVDAVEEYAIFRLDPDGRITSWNEGAKEMTGYETEEVVGEHVETFHTEADRAAGAAEQTLERASETGSVETEGWRVRSDGTQFWADVTVTAIRDEDGTHRGFLEVTRDATERHRRQREIETELQQILGRISDAFFAVDEELQVTHVNERAEELLQHREEALLGEHLTDVFPRAAEIDEVSAAFETALESQEATSVEFYHEPLELWVEANLYPSETGVSVYFRDVTDRIERERELAESEQRYRTLVEHFPNGAVALFDEDLEYTAVGGEVLDEVGTSADEIVGKTVWERYPEDVADRLEPKFRAAVEDGESDEFELAFHDRHWRAYTLPVRDADGEIFAGMTMVQDVTDRVERERALEESKNQLQALIELLPVAVFVAEADGEIVEWNEAAEEIWGGEIVESDSVAGYDAYEGWWADSGEPVEIEEWPLARALRGEEVTDPDEIVIEGFDGEERTILNHGVPVRDADGEISRAVVTAVDITERKEYQRKLEASNERLEQFAYAASHDLQEPLRVISSYLQLLERRYGDELDEDAREFLEFSVSAAERMRGMIEGLLEYSRVETGGEPFEPVDLDDVVEGARRDLAVRIEESDADVTAESLPRVEGDPSQLRQVFQNLLRNAIEYSGDEPPRIHVTAERCAPGSDADESGPAAEIDEEGWVVSVRDQGVGIDPEQSDRIFEVFERLHSQEQHQGTGIGLALCQRIVERHGGELWVESEPGEGSTFSFWLPAVRDESGT